MSSGLWGGAPKPQSEWHEMAVLAMRRISISKEPQTVSIYLSEEQPAAEPLEAPGLTDNGERCGIISKFQRPRYLYYADTHFF